MISYAPLLCFLGKVSTFSPLSELFPHCCWSRSNDHLAPAPRPLNLTRPNDCNRLRSSYKVRLAGRGSSRLRMSLTIHLSPTGKKESGGQMNEHWSPKIAS